MAITYQMRKAREGLRLSKITIFYCVEIIIITARVVEWPYKCRKKPAD